jgi:hypothetical protein
MEHDVMASENPSSKPTGSERKPAGGIRSQPLPAQPSGSPLSQDGLETLRDSHC